MTGTVAWSSTDPNIATLPPEDAGPDTCPNDEAAWTVDAPPQVNLKTELPPALWVTTGTPTVALVTCGGPFDKATGHYLDNVIVWARMTARPGTGR